MRKDNNENQHEKEDLKEVKENPWSYADAVSSKEEDQHWNSTSWTVLRGALERQERNSLKEKKYETKLLYLDGQDVINLLFSSGTQ